MGIWHLYQTNLSSQRVFIRRMRIIRMIFNNLWFLHTCYQVYVKYNRRIHIVEIRIEFLIENRSWKWPWNVSLMIKIKNWDNHCINFIGCHILIHCGRIWISLFIPVEKLAKQKIKSIIYEFLWSSLASEWFLDNFQVINLYEEFLSFIFEIFLRWFNEIANSPTVAHLMYLKSCLWAV